MDKVAKEFVATRGTPRRLELDVKTHKLLSPSWKSGTSRKVGDRDQGI